MKTSTSFALALLSAAASGLDAHIIRRAGNGHGHPITPPLENVASDKKFFGPPFPADYPHDRQPYASDEVFAKGQPYPKVQEQGFFDKDYVKDENGDGGEWAAQMAYDTARAGINNKIRRKEAAEKRAEEDTHDIDAAQKKYEEKKKAEDEAVEAAREAAKKAKEERKKADTAADKRTQLEEEDKARREAAEEARKQAKKDAKKAAETAEQAKEGMEKRVNESRDELAKERESFKNCQKQLDEAKAKVEILKRQRDELMHSQTNGTSSLLLRKKQMMEEQQRLLHEEEAKTAVAEARRNEALSKLAAVRNDTGTAEQKLQKEREEYEKAIAKERKEEKDLEEAEKELDSASTQLRRSRGEEALPAGARPPAETKSGAAPGAGSSQGLLVAALLLVSTGLLAQGAC